jgi:hypothetical protein
VIGDSGLDRRLPLGGELGVRALDRAADLKNGNADAIEDAVIGAWELQSGRQPGRP